MLLSSHKIQEPKILIIQFVRYFVSQTEIISMFPVRFILYTLKSQRQGQLFHLTDFLNDFYPLIVCWQFFIQQVVFFF